MGHQVSAPVTCDEFAQTAIKDWAQSEVTLAEAKKDATIAALQQALDECQAQGGGGDCAEEQAEINRLSGKLQACGLEKGVLQEENNTLQDNLNTCQDTVSSQAAQIILLDGQVIDLTADNNNLIDALEECQNSGGGGGVTITVPQDIGTPEEQPLINYGPFVLINPGFGDGARGCAQVIEDAMATGMQVRFVDGKYRIERTVILRDVFDLVGSQQAGKITSNNPSGTVLAWDGPSSDDMFFHSDSGVLTQVNLSSMVIDCGGCNRIARIVQLANASVLEDIVYRTQGGPAPSVMWQFDNQRTEGVGNDPHSVFTAHIRNQFLVAFPTTTTFIKNDGNARMTMANLDVQGARIMDWNHRNWEQTFLAVIGVTWHRNNGASEAFLFRKQANATIVGAQIDNFAKDFEDRPETFIRHLGNANANLVGAIRTRNEANQGLRNFYLSNNLNVDAGQDRVTIFANPTFFAPGVTIQNILDSVV